ncbi:Arabinose efflux permease [Pyrodictium delaneyi]|uniref:Arabinose efflux permease n=1 Tax=Pyrodictium delaneyi TaxID=1273541 RepID=A0A0P0N4H5_9CREN|nr:Arabinose efflux permease [Pyrodictium delaneyi]
MPGAVRVTGLPNLLAATLLFFTSVSATSSVISRYTRDIGASVAASGQVYALTPLVAALLRIPVGIAADRGNAKRFLVAGGFAATAAGIAAAFAYTVPMVALVRVLQGLALAFFVAPSIAAAAALGGEAFTRAISMRAVMVTAALIVGPLAAGFIVDWLGYWAVFIFTAITGFAAAVIATSIPLRQARIDRLHKGPGLRDALTLGVLLAIALAVVDGMVFFSVQSLPQMQLRDLGYRASVFGLFQSLTAASGLVARGLSSHVYTRLGPRRMLALGFALEAIGLSLLAEYPVPPLLYLAGILYGFGSGTSIPGEQMLASMSAPRSAGNRAASLYTLGFDVGGTIGLFVLSEIANSMGYSPAYSIAALAAVAAGTLALLVAGRATRRQEARL